MSRHNANAASYFVDRHINEGRGGKAAYREVDGAHRTLSYGQLAEQTSRVAGALLAHGIRREERVAILSLDRIELPLLFWGCLKSGAIPIPLNTLLAAPVYDEIIKDARASALFVSPELFPLVEPILATNPSLRHVVVIGGETPAGAISFEAFMAGAAPHEAIDVHEDEAAFWLYSSGSTGRPKGVRHVHASLKATADTFGAQVLGIKEADVVFSAAKIFFAYGLGNSMSFPLSVGATALLFSGRPTPDSVIPILEQEKPTIFYGVPTLYAAMEHALDKRAEPARTAMRLCVSAGEALPEEIGRSWKRLTGVDIVDGVGSTEMLHIFLSNRPGDIVYGTSGKPVPGYEIRLVDETGATVNEPGHVGELLVRGASAAEGYWNQRHKSRSTFEGEWTRTGDKYELTDGGRFIYCGRTDDMFKVSGIWVSPFEIEQALVSHPAVLEAAVVAWRDGDGLEKPKAYLVLKGQDCDMEALKTFVKEKTGLWKYPRWFEVVPDLPKTATGKIQRFKLRQGA